MPKGWVNSTGNLKRRVDFVAPVNDISPSGQPLQSFSVIFSTWAERDDVRGKERFAAGQESSEHQAVFLIRWRNDHEIKKDMQIVCEGKNYEIVSVAEIGYRQRFEIWTRIRRDD